jgi:peptidyl carrier protein
MTLASRIKDHIVHEYLSGDGADLELDTPLFGLNIIDSVAVFDLVGFLSREAGVTVTIDRVKIENFATIAAMVRMVEGIGDQARR